jgi:YaiO family outer membrane protein
MKRTSHLGAWRAATCLALFLAAFPGAAWAVGRGDFSDDEISAYRQTLRFRVEGGGSFEYLDPNDEFGNWGTGYLAFYARPLPRLGLSAQATGYARPGNEFEPPGRAVLGTVGISGGLTENIYSNTAGSYGSRSNFLPQYRVDQSFSAAFPTSENFTWALDPGGFYSRYYDDIEAYGGFFGPSFYVYYWNFGYQFIFTKTMPDALSSFSHLLFVGYDVEGWHDTDLAVSFGDNNFVGEYFADPEKTRRENFVEARLSHRQWIGLDWGLFAEAGYYTLISEVNKWEATLGGFVEF